MIKDNFYFQNCFLFTILICSIIGVSIIILKPNNLIKQPDDKNVINIKSNIKTSLIGVWKMYYYHKEIDERLIKLANYYSSYLDIERENEKWFLNCILERIRLQYTVIFFLNKTFDQKINGENTQAISVIINDKLHKIHKVNNIEKFRWIFEVPEEDTMIMTLQAYNLTLKRSFHRKIINHFYERC